MNSNLEMEMSCNMHKSFRNLNFNTDWQFGMFGENGESLFDPKEEMLKLSSARTWKGQSLAQCQSLS